MAVRKSSFIEKLDARREVLAQDMIDSCLDCENDGFCDRHLSEILETLDDPHKLDEYELEYSAVVREPDPS